MVYPSFSNLGHASCSTPCQGHSPNEQWKCPWDVSDATMETMADQRPRKYIGVTARGNYDVRIRVCLLSSNSSNEWLLLLNKISMMSLSVHIDFNHIRMIMWNPIPVKVHFLWSLTCVTIFLRSNKIIRYYIHRHEHDVALVCSSYPQLSSFSFPPRYKYAFLPLTKRPTLVKLAKFHLYMKIVDHIDRWPTARSMT